MHRIDPTLAHFAFCSGSPSNSLLLIANIRSPTRILWSYASIELASIFFTTKNPLSSAMVIPLRETAGVKQRTLIPSQSFIASTRQHTRAFSELTKTYQLCIKCVHKPLYSVQSEAKKGGGGRTSRPHSTVFVFGQTPHIGIFLKNSLYRIAIVKIN